MFNDIKNVFASGKTVIYMLPISINCCYIKYHYFPLVRIHNQVHKIQITQHTIILFVEINQVISKKIHTNMNSV